MKTPDTFKGFGIPQPIEIIRLKENSEAEFDRALARYRRQGISTEDAVQFVGISVICGTGSCWNVTPEVAHMTGAKNGLATVASTLMPVSPSLR